MENYFSWSEIGSGFEEPGGTPPLRIPRSTPPPLPGRIPQAKISRIPKHGARLNNKNISFQVGFGINLNNVGNPDSAFPSAVSKTLEGMQANLQNPFWMFQISSFPFQNSVVEAIRYLRYFAKNVIEERSLALHNGDETPNDILQHIVKEAQENSEIEMDDLVDNFFTIFIAGMKTKLNVLSCCLFVFLKIHIPQV